MNSRFWNRAHPARWSRTGWVVALTIPLAVSVAGCSPEPTPAPALTKAWELCTWAHPVSAEYPDGVMTADEACQTWLDNTDEETFIEQWQIDYAVDYKLAFGG